MEIKIDQPDGWDSEKNEKDVSDITWTSDSGSQPAA